MSPTSVRNDRPCDPSLCCKLCGRPAVTRLCRIGADHLYRCDSCNLHFLDRLDPPPVAQLPVLTVEQRRYIDARLETTAAAMTVRLQLVCACIDPAGRRALDVGAGVGQFQQLLVAAGAHCAGVEPSGLRRAYARQAFGLSLHPEPIDDPAWRGDAGRYDLLTLWDVLEHVNDPVATLQAAAALLRPGGLLFIETDHRDTLPYRLSLLCCLLSRGSVPLFLPSLYRPVPYGHKQIFRPDQLYALLARCGFTLQAAQPGGADSAGPLPVAYRPAGRIVLVAVRRDDAAAAAPP